MYEPFERSGNLDTGVFERGTSAAHVRRADDMVTEGYIEIQFSIYVFADHFHRYVLPSVSHPIIPLRLSVKIPISFSTSAKWRPVVGSSRIYMVLPGGGLRRWLP